VKHEDAVAVQWLACNMTDNPEQFRRAPMQGILDACMNAKYGDDDGGRDFMSPAETPF
jgi:hypothetical protein